MATAAEPAARPSGEAPETPPEEPVTPAEGDAEPEATDPPPEPESPPEAATEALSEREIEQAFDKLDREAKRHRSRLDEILGEAALVLDQCPLCLEHLAGWLYLSELDPEHAQAVIDVLSGFKPGDYAEAAYARACDACKGLGLILTGSRVPERRTIPCRKCNGFGFVTTETPTAAPVATAAPETPPETFSAPSETPPDRDFMGRTRDDPNFGVLAGYEK